MPGGAARAGPRRPSGTSAKAAIPPQFARPALPVEEDVTFHAHLEPVPNGQVQAACWAQIDHKSSIEVEAPEYLVCHNGGLRLIAFGMLGTDRDPAEIHTAQQFIYVGRIDS